MDEISDDLLQGYRNRVQTDEKLQAMMQGRQQLPVFHMKNTIMEAINENTVIIIRGNTGCGKTTQVIKK